PQITIASPPFFDGNTVYWQASDGTLNCLGVNQPGYNARTVPLRDGNGQTLLLKSAPFVAGGYVYFQDTNNALWRADNTGRVAAHALGSTPTSGSPVVTGEHVYFVGLDGKLLRRKIDGTGDCEWIGAYSAQSTPSVPEPDHVCFRDEKNRIVLTLGRLPNAVAKRGRQG
ncbi:hypothetical protein, partial [Corallococcus llansteffanensis]